MQSTLARPASLTRSSATLSSSATHRGVGLAVTSPAPRLARRGANRGVVKVRAEASEKNLEVMRKFSEQYAKGSGTYFCMDKSVTAVVIQGLAEHKDTLGSPLCPCRHYDDKEAEVKSGFWNCPCVPMRERKECHCMLFLTEDNDFVGDEQTITIDEVVELSEGMM